MSALPRARRPHRLGQRGDGGTYTPDALKIILKLRRSRLRALAASACCALSLAHATLAKTDAPTHNPPTATATREERLAVFDDVWRTVAERYHDPSTNGVDWPALRERVRPEAAGARDREGLYAVLRRMLAGLRDPHTRVYLPGEWAVWFEARYVSVGVVAREVEGEVSVASVERGSEAWRAGVRAGDTVLSVDEESAREAVARRLAEQPNATKASARARAVARLFDGPPGTPASVLFGTRGGEAKRVSLRRVSRVRAPSLTARRAGRFGVVRFNLFAPQLAGELARALRGELRGARGLVIDLRDNGGGESEAMTDIASLFLPPGTPLGRFTDRAGRTQSEPHTRAAMLSSPEVAGEFRGSVVVLTGARTASAAEVFAAALRERGRAKLLGEETCGCVLGVRRRHTLPDGGVLEVSEADFRTAAGARLEGSGLGPDERVAPDRRDLREGRDPALSRALSLLRADEARR